MMDENSVPKKSITGLHLLLSYRCLYECDHCFVWGSPSSSGTMTLEDICSILSQAKRMGTIETIYFEGGEPFLFYPVILSGLREAKKCGFAPGIVTNAYRATSVEDALEWLKPIALIGVSDLSLSTDLFHYERIQSEEIINAVRAAKQLELPVEILSMMN